MVIIRFDLQDAKFIDYFECCSLIEDGQGSTIL
jgi:hypothetical protein